LAATPAFTSASSRAERPTALSFSFLLFIYAFVHFNLAAAPAGLAVSRFKVGKFQQNLQYIGMNIYHQKSFVAATICIT
jgi:hypothetical protein